jgi:hypothetical protein
LSNYEEALNGEWEFLVLDILLLLVVSISVSCLFFFLIESSHLIFMLALDSASLNVCEWSL